MEDNPKSSNKLHIKEIIDQLNPQELKSFVLNYSRKDKLFEWTLKSHFVSKINMGDRGLKYKRILDELIKPKTLQNSKLGVALVKTVSIIFKDFVDQMHDCLSTENYTEAYYLISNCLSKISYIQNQFNTKNKSIESSRLEFLKGIKVVLEQDLAPGFRMELETSLKEIASSSYYVPGEHNLIDTLDQSNVLTETEKSEFIDALEFKLKSSDEWFPILKTIVKLSFPSEEKARAIMIKYNHDKLYQILKYLIYEGHISVVEFYLDPLVANFQLNRNILKTRIAIIKNDSSAVAKCINDIDLSSVQAFELNELINDIPQAYLSKEFNNLRNWINSLSISFKTKVLAKAEIYDELVKVIKSENDIDLLIGFDEQLLEHGYKKEVEELYYNISDSYLEEHIGTKAFQFMQKMTSRLILLSQHKMNSNITNKLSDKFGHRISFEF